MDELLSGLPGVVSIADDLVVYGADKAEHDRHLHLLLQRARAKQLVLNAAKCTIGASEVPFFGNIYSAEGVRPDPEKVQAIRDFTPPGQ